MQNFNNFSMINLRERSKLIALYHIQQTLNLQLYMITFFTKCMANSPGVLTILVAVQGFIIILYLISSYNKGWWQYKNVLSRMSNYNSKLFVDDISSEKQTQYDHFHRKNILQLTNEDYLVLFIAVLSHSSFHKRRDAIRESWWKSCNPSHRTICKFFTDGLTSSGNKIPDTLKEKLSKESRKHGEDLIVLDSASGTNFAVRLLIVMEYVLQNYDFDFFLRIDDDHYLCLDRIVKELPYRPKERLYWGFIHCQKGVTRIDEGWVLLTSDLVRTFVKTKDNLKCSRFADQSLAMWIYDLMLHKKIHWYGDQRIYHHPPVSQITEFKIRKEICHTFISLHGSYAIEMRVFHLIQEQEKLIYGDTYDIPPIIDTCPFERRDFNWKWFDPKYYTQPVPCKDNPIWKEGGEIFLGRSIDIRSKMKLDEENDKRWKENLKKIVNRTISPRN